jgi:3-oxoacyl-[acyl-carrier-protein] synthase II
VNDEMTVWITGVGAATPLGNEYGQIADNLLAGRSGVRTVASFDVTQHPSQIAGYLAPVPCPMGWEEQLFRKLHELEQLALSCSSQALVDSGWWEKRHDVRIGLILGVGAELQLVWETDALQGGNRIHDVDCEEESLVHRIRRNLGLSGPAVAVSAACASGNYSLAMARRWLQLGLVDVCLAGACDRGATPMGLAAFGNLRALSRRNSEPAKASRPFDRNRDGFVMGEGGAVFVLESAPSAKRRSARAYGEVAGCGASSDAHNMVIPSPDPEPAKTAMRQALADAHVEPGDVDYVNAHATSTPVGDVAEARVLEGVFGHDLGKVSVSSTKSMTGHLLTAAAAVEALTCLIAMERKAVPPTINLDEPDPDCNLCHVANHSRPQSVRVAVSNSFGFGGSNTCLVLKAV